MPHGLRSMASKPEVRQAFERNIALLTNFVLRSLKEKQKQDRQKGGVGKLYCCFVDFKTVPRALLWQVLEDLGVQGRVLDIIKSMYAHNSAAVRTSEGLSEFSDVLQEPSKDVPYAQQCVDGLERHLLETAGIDAPELCSILDPLLLGLVVCKSVHPWGCVFETHRRT